MSTAQGFLVGYGLTQALSSLAIIPIPAKRDPISTDKAQIGTLWINVTSNTAFILTSVLNNAANWAVFSNGGAGNFTSLTVNPGNATITAGNLSVTAGSITAGSTITAGTGATVTAGNLTLTGTGNTGNIVLNGGSAVGNGGNITTTWGNITSTNGGADVVQLSANGDLGTGRANATDITSGTNTAVSTGVLTIHGTTANPGANTGFLKFYVNNVAAFVPYFLNIAP